MNEGILSVFTTPLWLLPNFTEAGLKDRRLVGREGSGSCLCLASEPSTLEYMFDLLRLMGGGGGVCNRFGESNSLQPAFIAIIAPPPDLIK